MLNRDGLEQATKGYIDTTGDFCDSGHPDNALDLPIFVQNIRAFGRLAFRPEISNHKRGVQDHLSFRLSHVE